MQSLTSGHAGEQHESHPGQGAGGGGQDVTQAVGGPDGQAAEVPRGPGDEDVVEGEGGAGGHSEPVGVDGEPDGQAAEVPGGPGDEAVVEGEGGAGGHSEPVGVDGEPDGQAAEVPGEPGDKAGSGLVSDLILGTCQGRGRALRWSWTSW